MITFENIKTGKKVTFTAEQDPVARQAHMAAYLNSSNLSPNALKGQDFGWRLAPDVIAEMELIRTDARTMTQLASDIGAGIDDIRDYHILDFIARNRFAAEAIRMNETNKTNYEEEYNARLKEIREGNKPVSSNSDSTTQTDSAKIEEPKQIKKEK